MNIKKHRRRAAGALPTRRLGDRAYSSAKAKDSAVFNMQLLPGSSIFVGIKFSIIHFDFNNFQ